MTHMITGKTQLFEASRRRLMSIAYRMLGSVCEAEDVVQDAWIRWHETDHHNVGTPVAWLTTVVTRLSIDRLRRCQRERDNGVSWLPEPWLEDTAPSAEDTVSKLSDLSYGVLLLLERLSPDERAALLLHEVFDCQYKEVAHILDKTPAHCRQLVKRAKERVQTERTRHVTDEQVCRQLAGEFLTAIARQDKAAMLRLVAPDMVVIGDSGGSTPVAALSRHQGAGDFIDAVTSLSLSGLEIRSLCVNGGWGAAFVQGGEVVLVLGFAIVGQTIGSIYPVGDRQRLRGVQQRLLPHAAIDTASAQLQVC